MSQAGHPAGIYSSSHTPINISAASATLASSQMILLQSVYNCKAAARLTMVPLQASRPEPCAIDLYWQWLAAAFQLSCSPIVYLALQQTPPRDLMLLPHKVLPGIAGAHRPRMSLGQDCPLTLKRRCLCGALHLQGTVTWNKHVRR